MKKWFCQQEAFGFEFERPVVAPTRATSLSALGLRTLDPRFAPRHAQLKVAHSHICAVSQIYLCLLTGTTKTFSKRKQTIFRWPVVVGALDTSVWF